MKKQLLCFLLCLTVVFALLPVTAQASTEIRSIALEGLRYPDAGQVCSSYNAFTTKTSGISFYSVDWFDRTENRFLESNEKFVAGHTYSVQIWVEAKSGYAFKCKSDSVPDVTATLDGFEVEVSKAYEYKAFAMVVLTYDFPPIPKKGWISTAKVTVPAPVAGQKPSYTQLNEEKFSSKNVSFSGNTDENMKNGISWFTGNFDELSPENAVFAEQTVYGFHTLLFPAEGYSFHDNTKVYVNGKLAEAKWDYATFMSVTYKFPATSKLESSGGHTHTPSDWRTTQVYHYKVCTTCGDMLGEEDHKGGKATCAEPGKCTVCGYAYLETTEDHVPDTSKWIAREQGYHFHKCTLCGAHCDIEDHRWSPKYHIVDATGHAYQCADCKGYDVIHPHIAGPAGTPGAAEVCRDCGYIMKPSADHTHTLTLVAEVAPTCTDPGVNAYYSCNGCSQKFIDAEGKEAYATEEDLIIPPQGHQISNGWGFDEKTHWRICAVCKAKMIETDMEHDLQEGKCTVCEYGSAKPVESTPAATEPQPQKPQEAEKGGLPWWGILLIALGSIGAGVGVALLITKQKKKS